MRQSHPAERNLHSQQLLAALRAVKRGDFAVRLPLEQTGVAGEIAGAFNDVVELLDVSTKELERISRVAGKEGKIRLNQVSGKRALTLSCVPFLPLVTINWLFGHNSDFFWNSLSLFQGVFRLVKARADVRSDDATWKKARSYGRQAHAFFALCQNGQGATARRQAFKDRLAPTPGLAFLSDDFRSFTL